MDWLAVVISDVVCVDVRGMVVAGLVVVGVVGSGGSVVVPGGGDALDEHPASTRIPATAMSTNLIFIKPHSLNIFV